MLRVEARTPSGDRGTDQSRARSGGSVGAAGTSATRTYVLHRMPGRAPAVDGVCDTGRMTGTDRHRIVVGVDGSPASDAALAWACAEGRLRGSTVVALHVVVIPYELPRIPVEVPQSELEREGQQVLGDALARTHTDDVALEPRLLEGAAGELLVEASEDADLVVVGTRRHGGIVSFVRGSVSDTVVHHSHCPVVVMRV